MIGLPYPKLMNSNSDVDMGAAVIMCSVEAARRLGVSRGPVGVPTRRHRLPRAQLRLAPRHVRQHAGDRDRRAAAHWNSPASTIDDVSSHRPLLVLSRCGATRRAVTRHRSRPPVVAHRRADLRRRSVEQLRHARDRDDRRPTCANGPASTAWCGPTAGMPPSTRSASTRRSPAAGSATASRRTRSTRCPAASSQHRATPPARPTVEAYTVMFVVRGRAGTSDRRLSARRRTTRVGDVRSGRGDHGDVRRRVGRACGGTRRRRRPPPRLTAPHSVQSIASLPARMPWSGH